MTIFIPGNTAVEDTRGLAQLVGALTTERSRIDAECACQRDDSAVSDDDPVTEVPDGAGGWSRGFTQR
jgi:hypothetical protein